jgi:3-deoxy-D-manno-octulosonate cytidylyltransferase
VRAVAVIPARFASTRFPGKPLALLAGRPLIEHAWRAAVACPGLSRVVVATDDERIAAAVRAFGGEAVMTSPDHASGSDRLAEVARGLPADLYLNLQGDEPLMEGAVVEGVLQVMRGGAFDIGTAATPLATLEEYLDPDTVKVVLGAGGRALYFSRSPIPHGWETGREPAWRHIGVYAYTPGALARFTGLPPSPLEKAERLEQLRALENGMTVGVALIASYRGLGVDTPADLARAETLLARAPNGAKERR